MLYKEWRSNRAKFWILVFGFALMLGLSFVPGKEGRSYYEQWLIYVLPLTLFAGAALGCDVISGEAENGTLSFLLSRSPSRRKIYYSKFVVNALILLPVVAVSNFGMLLLDAGEGWRVNWLGGVTSTSLVYAFGLLVVSVSSLLSTLIRRTVYVFAGIAFLSLFVFLLCYSPVRSVSITFYNDWPEKDLMYISGWNLILVAIVLTLAYSLFVGGLAIFNRRAF